MIYFDEFRESEMADLAAIDRAYRVRLRKLMAHPGCDRCNEEEKDDELETRSTSRR